MPAKPKRPCSSPGCPELTTERFCELHKQKAYDYDRYRGTSTERGYDSRWRKARKIFLSRNPLCVECKGEGKLIEATVVDHITPHKGDKIKFWDQRNWQPLCKRHHDRKTATEDGGFGR